MPYTILWEVHGPHCETWRLLTHTKLACLHQPTRTQNIDNEEMETTVLLKPNCEFPTK